MIGFHISRMHLMQYASLALPISFAGFPLYVLAQDYYATTHGVSLTVLGGLLLCLRFFDAVQDPLIGYLSDKFRHVSLILMFVSSIILCSAIYGVFNVLPMKASWWFLLCMASALTAYGVLSINLNTLGGLWTADTIQQIRIVTSRETFSLLGLVVAVSLPNFLNLFISTELVYFYYCVILICLMSVAWICTWPWMIAHAFFTAPIKKVDISIYTTLRSIPHYTRRFLLIYALNILASSIPSILVIFFVRDYLGAGHLTGGFLLLYFLTGVAVMPLWKHTSRLYGKYRVWQISMLLAVGSFFWTFFLSSGDIWQFGLICLISGAALGADITLPTAILADQIHNSRTQSYAGVQYGLLAFVAKLMLALASAVLLPVLDHAGFVPMSKNADHALFVLRASYTLLPCLLKCASALLLTHCFVQSEFRGHHEYS